MQLSARRKKQLWVIGTVAVFVALVAFYHWRQSSRLGAFKKQLQARGELLSLKELEARYPNNSHSNGSATILVTTIPGIPTFPIAPGTLLLMNSDIPGRARVAARQPLPLQINSFYLSKTNKTVSGPTNTWDDLHQQMQAAATALAQIRQMLKAPDRDYGWHYGNMFNYPGKIFVQKRTATQAFAAATVDELHRGNVAAALENCEAIARLANLHDHDWMLVNQMIRTSMAGLGIMAGWEVLQEPNLSDAQLAALQTEWQQVDLLGGMAPTLEIERAQIIGVFEQLDQPGNRGLRQQLYGGGPATAPTIDTYIDDYIATPTWRAVFADADQLFYLNSMQSYLDIARMLPKERSWRAIQPEVARAAKRVEKEFEGAGATRLMVSAMTIPNFQKAYQTLLRNETLRQMLLANIALRRYQLRHGQYPAQLSAVVPEFLPALPLDSMNGKPLHYRLNQDGTFTLYSVGEDGNDDGGDAFGKKSGLWDGRDAVWPRAAIEPVTSSGNDTATFMLYDTSFKDVARSLARAAGLSLSLEPEVSKLVGDYPLNLYHEKVTAEAALNALLANFNLVLVKTDGTNAVVKFKEPPPIQDKKK